MGRRCPQYDFSGVSRFSGYVNGVAMRHGEVSRGMFPSYEISAITNGVHATTWTSAAFSELFDSFIPRMAHRQQLSALCDQHSHSPAIRQAHAEAKSDCSKPSDSPFGVQLDPNSSPSVSRAGPAPISGADLLFQDPERLRKIAREVGPIQLVYGGKAHPHDEGGKNLIRRVVGSFRRLLDAIARFTLRTTTCAGAG